MYVFKSTFTIHILIFLFFAAIISDNYVFCYFVKFIQNFKLTKLNFSYIKFHSNHFLFLINRLVNALNCTLLPYTPTTSTAYTKTEIIPDINSPAIPEIGRIRLI